MRGGLPGQLPITGFLGAAPCLLVACSPPTATTLVAGSRTGGPETVAHVDLSGAVRECSWRLGSSRGAACPGRAWSVLSVPLPAALGSACGVSPTSVGWWTVREVEV